MQTHTTYNLMISHSASLSMGTTYQHLWIAIINTLYTEPSFSHLGMDQIKMIYILLVRSPVMLVVQVGLTVG